MKYIITGCSGFVGRYLIEHIFSCEPDANLIGVDMAPPSGGQLPCGFKFHELNLLDSGTVLNLVKAVQPDFIVHLASFSSVAFSWQQPIDSFKNNTNIFLNLLDAVRSSVPACRVLSIGSSEEYGIVTEDETPLREEQPLRPASPYAVARVAQEHLSTVYAQGFGMDIVCTRSFNHVGPRQSDRFVVSSIARQFAELKLGTRSSITTGDTSVIRDFLDVRDVVRAYHLLLRRGRPGEVYNVCSGVGRSIHSIITMLKELTRTQPPLETDKALLRPVENRVVVGAYDKLFSATGWRPSIPLDSTLSAVVDYWQKTLSR